MPFTTTLQATASALLDAVLPQTCVVCGVWVDSATGPTCEACRTTIEAALGQPYCPRCGRTLPKASIFDEGCAKCRRERFWNVAGVARVCAYPRPLRAMLNRLKYHGHVASAQYLGRLLATEIAAQPWCDELQALVPVPMHWLRRWQRPVDHARQLAAVVADELRLPVRSCIQCTKHTPSQVGLPSRAARFANVKGTFASKRDRLRMMRGRTVCIIDNVMLSGATVHEMSKVLRRAGAVRIFAAVVARPNDPTDAPSSPAAAAAHRDRPSCAADSPPQAFPPPTNRVH